MFDKQEQRLVAVKKMPNSWVRGSHKDFLAAYPHETEWPWQDIGCTRFLNSLNFPHCCALYGVYKGAEDTAVMTQYANEGDLFTWCAANSIPPGPEREAMVRPLVVQFFEGLQRLHQLTVVHRDVSMENVLVSKEEDGSLHLHIIDFGMAKTQRYFNKPDGGKRSYQ